MSAYINIKITRSADIFGVSLSPCDVFQVAPEVADKAVSLGVAEFSTDADRQMTNDALPDPDTKACPFIRELRNQKWTAVCRLS